MLAAVCSASCGGSGKVAVTERLWISDFPTKPTSTLSAFATTRGTGGKFVGGFYRGSLYRGEHDAVEWVSEGANVAKLRFLQDGARIRLEFERCEPTRGFDYCIVVKGDPYGTRRYQSRKRWAVKRRGKRDSVFDLMPDALFDVAYDDSDFQAWIRDEQP